MWTTVVHNQAVVTSLSQGKNEVWIWIWIISNFLFTVKLLSIYYLIKLTSTYILKSVNVTMKIIFYIALRGGICDHLRSILFFTESVNQAIEKRCTFEAHPLRSVPSTLPTMSSNFFVEAPCRGKCPEMGINAELYEYQHRIFHVTTTAREPYCNIWNHGIIQFYLGFCK